MDKAHPPGFGQGITRQALDKASSTGPWTRRCLPGLGKGIALLGLGQVEHFFPRQALDKALPTGPWTKCRPPGLEQAGPWTRHRPPGLGQCIARRALDRVSPAGPWTRHPPPSLGEVIAHRAFDKASPAVPWTRLPPPGLGQVVAHWALDKVSPTGLWTRSPLSDLGLGLFCWALDKALPAGPWTRCCPPGLGLVQGPALPAGPWTRRCPPGLGQGAARRAFDSQDSIQDGRVGSYAFISSLDFSVFSGLGVVSKDPAGHLLIFIHQHWMDSVRKAKTFLICHDYFQSITLLIIQ